MRGDPITWRPPLPSRGTSLLAAGLIAVLCVASIVVKPAIWLAYPLLLAVPVLASDVRRRCDLTADRIVVQGRWGRRTVELAELRQAGLAKSGIPWVQTRLPRPDGGDVTLLRLVPLGLSLGQSPTASADVVAEIRQRAETCGAQLEPALPGPVRPPTARPLVLGI